MAPALPLAPPEPPDLNLDAIDQSHRRQVLAPVDNLSEDDVMGLQNHSNIMKDQLPLGDQLLVDLSGNDLLSVIKTLETNNDQLSTGEAESIFPLDLPEPVDSESDSPEQRVMATQVRIERRSALLLRRLRILQARALGKRVSEEVTQTFDKCTRGARKDGAGRPMGLKALLKRVETTATLQASAASRSVVGPKYYNAGTSRGDASKSASVGISSGTLTGLEDTAGALKSHLSVIKHELDSDATLSSSGAESNDECVVYNNPHQQPMPIEKRALWTWQRERATIASRWCWLQTQVKELNYKIRQHKDLAQQIREAKGLVEFEGEPVAYEGSLPGADEVDDPALETCARVRPLRRDTFKKRKLLQMHNLHLRPGHKSKEKETDKVVENKKTGGNNAGDETGDKKKEEDNLEYNKARRPADLNCDCDYPSESCALCTGRRSPMEPALPAAAAHAAQRVALVDPGFHAVLSDVRDIKPSTHMSALCSRSWFRPRVAKPAPRVRPEPSAPREMPPKDAYQPYPPPKPLKKHPKLKRGRPPLSRKIREREREEEASGNDRGRSRASTESRSWRRQSYDIDNIVIPQSVAANTRPQILEYKEIITPKWRVMELPDAHINNGVSKSYRRMSFEDSDDEDVTDAAINSRHIRAETRERSRYVRKGRARRSHADDATLDVTHDVTPLPPTQPQTQPPTTPTETIPPYSPRRFPLPEDTYVEMLAVMPDGYRPISPDPPTIDEVIEDDSSTLSPVSPSAYEGDDPDDLEWDPSVEKVDRKKSTFR